MTNETNVEQTKDINIKRCDSFSEYIAHELADYIHMRDAWQYGTPQWHTYDLLVRELTKIESAHNYYAALTRQGDEKEIAEKAWDASRSRAYYDSSSTQFLTRTEPPDKAAYLSQFNEPKRQGDETAQGWKCPHCEVPKEGHINGEPCGPGLPSQGELWNEVAKEFHFDKPFHQSAVERISSRLEQRFTIAPRKQSFSDEELNRLMNPEPPQYVHSMPTSQKEPFTSRTAEQKGEGEESRIAFLENELEIVRKIATDRFESITALEAENKRLREGWVRVEDRLPEIGGEWNESVYVLAVGYMFSEPISCFYTERTGWEFASPLVKGKPERVTHWQPLPTPPRKRRINCK
jgi:hypothetical protein